MPPSARVHFGVGLMTLVTTVLALSAAGGAHASYPASAQRLLVKTEEFFSGSGVDVIDERGRVRASLGIVPGLNRGIAVSRRGTRLAYVRAATLDLPGDVPPRYRREFERLPRSTLQLDTFLLSTQTGGGVSIEISSVPARAAVGRPAWAPSGRRIVFSQRARAA